MINGKYALVVGALILLLVFTTIPESKHTECEFVEGIVTDCSQSEKGYVLTVLDDADLKTRCFSKIAVEKGTFMKATGQQSSDGDIFFIAEIVSNSSYTPIGSKTCVCGH